MLSWISTKQGFFHSQSVYIPVTIFVKFLVILFSSFDSSVGLQMTSEDSVISVRSDCSSSVTKFGQMRDTHTSVFCSLIYLTRSF